MTPDAVQSGLQALPHVEALADFCARLVPADLPDRVATRTKSHLLDTVGAALAGTRSVEFRKVRALAAPGGTVPLLASPQRTGPRDAALANGVAAHVFELDDSGGCDHTGAVILPALIAALSSCHEPVSGGDLLCALTAGYEVGRRVLDASGGYGVHNGAGWHSTGTCGTLAAAAAVARLRGYDSALFRHALTLATSFSSGLWAFNHDGSQAKKVHAGRAAEGGLLATDLAAAGFSGPSQVFEDVWGGFFRTYVRDAGQPTELSAGLGTNWKVERASLKPYAACRGAHSAIDAVGDILSETGRTAADIARIDLRLSSFLMDMCGRVRLETLAGAQMSLGYALAALVVFGRVDLEQYSAAARRDSRLAVALDRIRFHPDPHIPQMAEPEVTVTFTDGETRTAMVPRATGSSERPMSDVAIRAKFDSLASMALPAARVAVLADFVGALEGWADCRGLPELLVSDEPEAPFFI
ncbi:MmgE/PrpD family protein [Ensifer sesbaniae]|jgi:2-methylcitrate dehydratase PrpD|uniref:MmgE/PrpD family protein n=1 Tax=Ensifer sesbaniae TaxID=1214071 RepID=UPI001568138E|nr:MmgE/PrpD family protein [Ensifer sesbaniae]NRQ17806.1 2-methylcitrate dehydratase [Ensifer sesbaniae]